MFGGLTEDALAYEYCVALPGGERIPTGRGLHGLEAAAFKAKTHHYAAIERIEWVEASDGITMSQQRGVPIAAYAHTTGFWAHLGTRNDVEAMVIQACSLLLAEQGAMSAAHHFAPTTEAVTNALLGASLGVATTLGGMH